MPTVTYAVCAYNEGQNIVRHIASVLRQKEIGFRIEKILIVSDGSTDNTVKLAKSQNHKKIEVIAYKNRVGKSSRYNKIYKSLTTDILVQSDADVVLNDQYVLSNVIKPLIKHKTVMLTSGNSKPLSAKTFTEFAVNKTVEAYQELKYSVRDGHSIFCVTGQLLASKKEFVKGITIPRTMFADDTYMYLTCISKGYKYRFVPNAIIMFRSVQTLREQIRQNTRFESAQQRFKDYFPSELVDREYYIPSRLLWKCRFKQFIRYPIHSFYIYVVNMYCRRKSKSIESKLDAKWSIAETTKQFLQ